MAIEETKAAENLRNNQEETKAGGGVKEYPSATGLYYFAHPYTATDKRAELANFNLCCIRTAKLMKAGYYVYSPICHTHPIHMAWPEFLVNDERELWIALDMVIIRRANFTGLILAPLWEQSGGCCGERDEFLRQGKEICLYEDIMKQK